MNIYLLVALVGSLIGAFMEVKEGDALYGVVPMRLFNATVGAGFFCLLYFAFSSQDPNGIY